MMGYYASHCPSMTCDECHEGKIVRLGVPQTADSKCYQVGCSEVGAVEGSWP